MCFSVGMSAFCLQNKRKWKQKKQRAWKFISRIQITTSTELHFISIASHNTKPHFVGRKKKKEKKEKLPFKDFRLGTSAVYEKEEEEEELRSPEKAGVNRVYVHKTS